MVVAKSRLQKVPNVRKKLHNYRGTFSQNAYDTRIRVMKKARQAGRSLNAAAVAAGKKGMQLAKQIKQTLRPPPTKYSVRKAAIENVRELKAKHALAQLKTVVPTKRPSISQSSIASQKSALKAVPPVTQKVVQGPTRAPPPPPIKIPARPSVATPKVAPKVPPKPMVLRGNKMK